MAVVITTKHNFVAAAGNSITFIPVAGHPSGAEMLITIMAFIV